jgi:cation diffusion facilitator family transporter
MRPQLIIAATLVLDAILFALNLAVASLGGSRTVLSQAVYNVTDLVGGLMILWGYLASRRPPDVDHPFGHGKERFFWSFTASLVAFTLAGVEVLTTGIEQAIDPHPLSNLPEGLLVVGATLALSLVGVWVMIRELRAGRESLATLLESSHQGLKTIFFQDLVSVFGSIVAFVGLVFVFQYRNWVWDGYTASAVGLLMMATGFVLAAESRELLVGKAMSPSQAREILRLVERDPRVRKVRSLQSMMLGPEDVLLAMRVNFQDGMDTDQIESTIDQLSIAMRGSFPGLRHLVIEPES